MIGLKPIINTQTKVLILGSFPGKLALEKQEYYGNPRNSFWKIILDLLHVNKKEDYGERINLLLENKIGLWDVIKSCYREGSSDGTFREIDLNNIRGFLENYPSIKAIFLNGRDAERLFRQNIISHIHAEYLPSTSSANAKSYNLKRAEWSKILNLLS